MKKLLIVILVSLAATASPAKAGWMTKFVDSVSQCLGVKGHRLGDVADEVLMLGPNVPFCGVASYNKITNYLGVEGRLLNHGRLRLKDLKEMAATHNARSADSGFNGTIDDVNTVLHELAHAEWDYYIEEPWGDGGDRSFYGLNKREIIPWIKANDPRLDPMIAVQEWHGYYVGELYGRMLRDYRDILVQNGIGPVTHEINEHLVRQNILSGKITESEFGRLTRKALGEGELKRRIDLSYGSMCRALPITVSGVSFMTSDWNAKGFKSEWWDALWWQVRDHHHLPESPQSILAHQNRSLGDVLLKLEAVQRRIWAEVKGRQATGGSGGGIDFGSGEGLFGETVDGSFRNSSSSSSSSTSSWERPRIGPSVKSNSGGGIGGFFEGFFQSVLGGLFGRSRTVENPGYSNPGGFSIPAGLFGRGSTDSVSNLFGGNRYEEPFGVDNPSFSNPSGSWFNVPGAVFGEISGVFAD